MKTFTVHLNYFGIVKLSLMVKAEDKTQAIETIKKNLKGNTIYFPKNETFNIKSLKVENIDSLLFYADIIEENDAPIQEKEKNSMRYSQIDNLWQNCKQTLKSATNLDYEDDEPTKPDSPTAIQEQSKQ